MDVHGYHHSVPDWRRPQHPKAGQLIGVELEVYHYEGSEYAAEALDSVDYGPYPAPFAEEDSSLDEDRGVEIICPPLPLEEAVSSTGYIARVMRALDETGTNRGDELGGYGMHVNINLEGWSGKEKLLVQYLINAFSGFGERVGRRDGEGAGGYVPTFRYERLSQEGLTLCTHAGDKHCAAYIRRAVRNGPEGVEEGRVMEVRFPKTTLEIQDLRNVIDYVFALRDWVRAAPNHTEAACFLAQIAGNTGRSAVEHVFGAWCTKHRPGVADILGYSSDHKHLLKKRLDVMREMGFINDINHVGLHHNDPSDPAGAKKQAERICKIISSGARLQGELTAGSGGFVSASTVRATA